MKKQRIRLPNRNGLVGEWLLNGNGNDTSGNGNNGTTTNVTYSKTDRGYQTYAGNFNGSSSYVSMGDVLDFEYNQPFSISVVLNNSITGGCNIVSKQENGGLYVGYGLGTASDGKLQFFLYAGGTPGSFIVNFPSSYNDGKPHKIDCTYDGSNTVAGIKLYVDGSQVSGTVISNIPFSVSMLTSASFQISGRGGAANLFNGNIQSVRIFNRALSETEIRDWYLEGLRALGGSSLSGLMDGLVAYYDFRGDANDIISGYNGTVNGATLTTDRFGTANGAYNFPAGAVILPPSNSQTYRGNDLTVVATVKIPVANSDNHVVYGTGYLWSGILSDAICMEHYPASGNFTSGLHGKNPGDIVQCVWIKSSTAGVLLYVDGTLIASNPSATGDASIYDYPTIGYRRWQGSYIYPFLSDLYDLQIYNGVISPERIKAMAELSKQSKLLPFA